MIPQNQHITIASGTPYKERGPEVIKEEDRERNRKMIEARRNREEKQDARNEYDAAMDDWWG